MVASSGIHDQFTLKYILKNSHWGFNNPLVIPSGVVGHMETCGGSSTHHAHFSCVSAEKNHIVSQRINKYTLKTYVGAIKAPPSSSVVSLAAQNQYGLDVLRLLGLSGW